MTTAKNKVFIELLFENCYLVQEMNFWCGGWGGGGGAEGGKNLVMRKSKWGENFSWWRR